MFINVKLILKSIISVLLVSTILFAWMSSTGFCEGWETGYKAGYCYSRGYACIEPIVPICPIPRIGEDSYQGGYNRGFISGLQGG